MGMVDAPEGLRGMRRGRRHGRHGFQIDMTPMVDVVFLLLTFFMLTTTFGKPNVMEIVMPPETAEASIPTSNILTIRIPGDGNAYYSIGDALPHNIPFYEQDEDRPVALSDEFRSILRHHADDNERLVVIVKVGKQAKYRNFVDLIDELHLLRISRFSLDHYSVQDDAAVKGALREETAGRRAEHG